MLIIKDGFIFESLREQIKNKAASFNKTLGIYISKLLSCAQCLGFWCGFFIFFLYNIPELHYYNLLLESIYFGFITSVVGYISDLYITYIDETVYKLTKENEGKANKN